MFCAHCGIENPDSGRFCIKCGAPFSTAVPPPAATVTEPAISIDTTGIRLGHVLYIAGTVIAIIGLNLSWVSEYFFSASGASLSFLLGFEEFLLVVFAVFVIVDALVTSVSTRGLLRIIGLAVACVAMFLTVVKAVWIFIQFFSAFSFVGPIVTVLGNVAVLVVALMSLSNSRGSRLRQPIVIKERV